MKRFLLNLMIVTSLLFTTLTVFAEVVFRQQCKLEEPPLTVLRVKTAYSNASAIIGPVQTFLVDTGDSRSWRQIKAEIEEFNPLAWEQLTHIIITHAHFDHAGSATRIQELTNADIITHAGDAYSYERGITDVGNIRQWPWSEAILVPVIQGLFRFKRVFSNTYLEEAEYDLENIVVSESFPAKGYIWHIPGHTPGSLGLVLACGETRLALLGDTVVGENGKLAKQMSFAHDWDLLDEQYERIIDKDFDLIFPGHGNTVFRRQK